MKKTYIITKIDGLHIFAAPQEFLSENTEQALANIEVINPKNIKIKVGSKVYIGLPKTAEMLNGFFALLTPIFACFIALILSSFIANLLSLNPTESFKAVCVVIAFLTTSTAVLIYTRNIPTIVKLQVLGLANKKTK
ncbi:MAG: SoxR reducing system RseC family protein [Treponema sp.]|nr:SoxR reducing system RseC family protein [Treponema sp.]